jgi:hypothetical protein
VDCNDPALFIGEAEGMMQVTLPLDDHVLDTRFNEPLTAYTLTCGVPDDLTRLSRVQPPFVFVGFSAARPHPEPPRHRMTRLGRTGDRGRR